MSVTMGKVAEPIVRMLLDTERLCIYWHLKPQPYWFKRTTWGGRFGLRRGSIHVWRLWVSW